MLRAVEIWLEEEVGDGRIGSLPQNRLMGIYTAVGCIAVRNKHSSYVRAMFLLLPSSCQRAHEKNCRCGALLPVEASRRLKLVFLPLWLGSQYAPYWWG
jgi:hypothetical protein